MQVCSLVNVVTAEEAASYVAEVVASWSKEAPDAVPAARTQVRIASSIQLCCKYAFYPDCAACDQTDLSV